MKKLFIAAMALATIVSCSKENEEVIAPVGGETALLSVSLKSAGTMRSNPEEFVYGTDAENSVKNATFYFFDSEGAAYEVADGTNAITVTPEQLGLTAGTAENVEEVSNMILVIKQSKVVPPAKMVAVLNAPVQQKVDLADLQEATTDWYNNGYGFVMSNSVYEENGKVVDATEILAENIFTTSEPKGEVGSAYPAEGETADKNAKAVQIYVERVAARVDVEVDIEEGVLTVGNDKLYPVTLGKGASEKDADTFVKILGWEVTNAAKNSSLLKKYAEPTATDGFLFEPFNNHAFHRSYWAETSEDIAAPEHNLKFDDIANTLGYAYYNENTLSPVNAEGWFNAAELEGATKASQIIVAAQLVDAQGKAKEFAKWYGTDYENGADLQEAMINNAAKQIFVKADDYTAENQHFVSIAAKDVTFYQIGTGDYTPDQDVDRRYEVRVKGTEGAEYFDATGKTMSVEAATAILAKIEPAMIWKTGLTYYYTMINHFGDADGVVRNHSYDVNITAFHGLGTPVFEKDDFVIIPEIPVEQKAYNLTAQINVLSWALVSNDVELGM